MPVEDQVCCFGMCVPLAGSWLFSRRYRPRIIRWVLPTSTMDGLVEQRRQLVAQQRKEWARKAGCDVKLRSHPEANGHAADEEGGTEKAEVALPDEQLTPLGIGEEFSWDQGGRKASSAASESAALESSS